jgi:hypothetical protein
MINQRVLLRTVAVLAVLAGALLVAGGLGHLQAVMKVNQGRPLDFRMLNLLSIGVILLAVGGIDLVSSWRMWRESRYALLVSAAATVALVVYLAVLLTLPERGDPIRFFLFAQSSYLAVASVVALYLLSRRKSGLAK